MSVNQARVAVVIPCYKVRRHILDVIKAIGLEVERIYVVDDKCPEASGDFVEQNCTDARVKVLRNVENLGVGGAVMHGYGAAIQEGLDVIVKVDGDGQMDPVLIPDFIEPILNGEADYTKGNRFYDLEQIRAMPRIRIVGNAGLSLLAKLSTGYWDLFDPTNGYTAIHADVVKRLPLQKISRRYFFETDILFHLSTVRAVTVDVPMHAKYGDEESNLKITKVFGEFLVKHFSNFCKRVFYNYYLRDMSLASVELPLGLFMLTFGILFGTYHWVLSWTTGVPAFVGTVMLSALPIILGLQLLLAFLAHDIQSVPRRVLHRRKSRLIQSLRSP